MTAAPADATVPASLRDPDLAVVWRAARQQLDRFGSDRRGTVAMPTLTSAAELALRSLLDRPITSRLDLGRLELALVERSVGIDLDDALSTLGAARSVEAEAQRVAAAQRGAAKSAVREATADWSEEWVTSWSDWMFTSGQFAGSTASEALFVVDAVRRLLDALDRSVPPPDVSSDEPDVPDGRLRAADPPPGRNDLAVRIAGSAHALDDGLRLERCARRALWHRLGEPSSDLDGRDLWAAAGVTTDQVSAPVLTWRLPIEPTSILGALAQDAAAAGVPLHLSLFALRRHRLDVVLRTPVLLVENPRLVEAAAERGTPWPVIATNGNPSSAVTHVVAELVSAGVEIRHHGDFDSAGIAICRRLMDIGCTPWRMSADDYDGALELATSLGVELPADPMPCGPTPWDPTLEARFDTERSAVHEELLIDHLLDPATWWR